MKGKVTKFRMWLSASLSLAAVITVTAQDRAPEQKQSVSISATDTRISESGIDISSPGALSDPVRMPSGSNRPNLLRTTGEFKVTRKGSTLLPLTVRYSLSGSASSGTDYGALSGELQIAAGAASAPIKITTLDDDTYEGDETLTVRIEAPPSAPYLGAEPMSAAITIVDDENQVTVRGSTRGIGETGSDNSATFTVTRTGPTTRPITVNYAIDTTISNAARSGEDYQLSPGPEGSVVIAAGSASANITITAVDDSAPEPDEWVKVLLRSGSGYAVAPTASGVPQFTFPGGAQFFILDNDSTVQIVGDPPGIAILESNPGASYTFVVSRSGDTTTILPFQVRYRTEGTATQGVDYTLAVPNQLFFPVGAASVTITITPIWNESERIREGDEDVIVTLQEDPERYKLGTSTSARVVISEKGQTFAVRP